MLNHVLPRTNKLYASGTFGKEVVCRIKCLFAWSVGIFNVALMIFRIDKICLNCVFCKKCKYEWMRVRCNKLEPRLIFIWNLVTIKRQIHNTKCYFSRIDCYMVTPPLNAFTLSNKLNSKCLFSVFDSIICYIRFIQVTVDWREGSASGASKKKKKYEKSNRKFDSTDGYPIFIFIQCQVYSIDHYLVTVNGLHNMFCHRTWFHELTLDIPFIETFSSQLSSARNPFFVNHEPQPKQTNR